jgi:hypothetical protein
MRRGIVFFLLGILWAGTASAQSYRSFSEEYRGLVEKARWRLGPFLLFPKIALRDIGFDDNLYFGSDRGDPVKDFTATLSPEMRAYWPLRDRLILYIRDNPEYAYYLKESYQRSFTNGYGAGFRYRLLGRFVLSGEFGDDKHRRRVSSEFQVPATDRVRSLSGGVFYETARKTSIGVTGIVRKISYEDVFISPENAPVSRLLDREERSLEAEAYYQLFSDGFLFLRGGVQEYRFLDETSLWRNATSTSFSAGLRFPLLGRVRGLLNLGYKDFDPKKAGEPSFSGLVGDTGIDVRSGRFAFRLVFARDLVFSTYAQVFYFIENSWRTGGSFYLASFLRMDYDFSQGRADYSGRAIEPAPEEGIPTGGRVDRHRRHSVGLTVRVFRTMGIGLAWNSERWTSAPAAFDRSRNFVGIVWSQNF